MKALAVFMFAVVAVGQQVTTGALSIHPVNQDCPKGQYRSFSGECLHDQTGERHAAGDGCNWSTCLDAACSNTSTTLAYCLHPDDPAVVAPKAPLKCGKYQHVEHWADRCVDDLHLLTEKEWQEVLSRLNALKKSAKKNSGITYSGSGYRLGDPLTVVSGLTISTTSGASPAHADCPYYGASRDGDKCEVRFILPPVKHISCDLNNKYGPGTLLCTWAAPKKERP